MVVAEAVKEQERPEVLVEVADIHHPQQPELVQQDKEMQAEQATAQPLAEVAEVLVPLEPTLVVVIRVKVEMDLRMIIELVQIFTMLEAEQEDQLLVVHLQLVVVLVVVETVIQLVGLPI